MTTVLFPYQRGLFWCCSDRRKPSITHLTRGSRIDNSISLSSRHIRRTGKDREQPQLRVLIKHLKYNGDIITVGMCDSLGIIHYLEEGIKTSANATLSCCLAQFLWHVPSQIVKQHKIFTISDSSRYSDIRHPQQVYIFNILYFLRTRTVKYLTYIKHTQKYDPFLSLLTNPNCFCSTVMSLGLVSWIKKLPYFSTSQDLCCKSTLYMLCVLFYATATASLKCMSWDLSRQTSKGGLWSGPPYGDGEVSFSELSD